MWIDICIFSNSFADIQMPSEVSHEQTQIADSRKKQKIDAISPHQSLPKTLSIFLVIYIKRKQLKKLHENLNRNYECARVTERETDRFIMPITTHHSEHFISSGIATSWAFLDTGNAGLFSQTDHNLLSSENPVGIGDAREGKLGNRLKKECFSSIGKYESAKSGSQKKKRKSSRSLNNFFSAAYHREVRSAGFAYWKVK